MDYCFLRDHVGGEYQSVLVGKDRRSEMIFAHVVPHKGATVDWLIPQLVRDLQKLGFWGAVTIKTDGEPAIAAVVQELARARGNLRTILEMSPPSDSQSNGHAERAIRTVEELTRVHKLALESKLGGSVPVSHAILPWLVEHVVDLANKHMVGRDGRTPYERLKGKKFHGEFPEFASRIMLRVSEKVRGGVMQARWIPGIWLGMRFHTGEHIVAKGSDGGVVRGRAIREVPHQLRREDLDGIRGSPWAPSGVVTYHPNPDKVDSERANSPVILTDASEPVRIQPRSVYLTREMFDRLGFTPGCAKCRGLEHNLPQGTLGHSPKCRARMERLLQSDKDFSRRLEQAEARKTRYLAEEVERADPQEGRAQSSATMAQETATGGSSSSSDVNTGAPTSSSPAASASEPSLPARPDQSNQTPAGSKRKAAEEPDDSHRGQQEIPLPEAGDEEPALPGMDIDGGQALDGARQVKRPLDGADAEPHPTRMRLELLTAGVHGGHAEEEDKEMSQLVGSICLASFPMASDTGGAAWENGYGFSTGQWESLPAQHDPTNEFDPEAVQTAKRTEYQTLRDRGTYRVVPRSEMEADREAVHVSCKWVITNKGTRESPIIKARYVAREFVSKAIDRDELYAATPGLMTMRLLLSRMASTRAGNGGHRCGMILDVKGAFLYGDARRRIYIELPECDPAAADADKVGIIERALYGTRDAPQLWQEHARATLQSLGFIESRTTPSVYVHKERDLEISLHVDDFLAVGDEEGLLWLRESLAKAYTLKSTLIGPEPHHAKEVAYLGRTIRWTPRGVEIEGNGKHVRDLLECLGMTGCRGVETPIAVENIRSTKDADPTDPELSPSDASRYRRCAAIIVYLSQDRPDLSMAACHLARGMAVPRESDLVRLKRAARYLKAHPRLILLYEFQEDCEDMKLFTDSDWANDHRTRKSHSGGVIFAGRHLVGHWSRIQPVIALSSGEAELYASVTGMSRFVGLVNLARELRGETWGKLSHSVDASACKSLILKKGVGGIKHMEAKYLWVQEAVERKKIAVHNIPRASNVADALASYSPGPTLRKQLLDMNCYFME